MSYSSIITTNPAVRIGKPSIRDTRVTVTDVLEYLAGGKLVRPKEGLNSGELRLDPPGLILKVEDLLPD